MELSATGEVSTDALVLAADHADEAIVVIDSQQCIHWINRSAERLWGVQRRRIIGLPLQDLVPPGLKKHLTPRGKRQRSRLDALQRHRGDIPLQRPDGSCLWFNMRVHALPGRGLRVIHLTDVQARRELEKRIELLSVGFDEAHAAVLITDPQGSILHINKGLRRLLGFSDGELTGRQLTDLLLHEQQPARYQSLLQRLLSGQVVRDEVQVRSHNGTTIWCEVNAHPVQDPRRGIRHLVLVLTDITESRVHTLLLNQLLEAMARETPTHDVMDMLCREVEMLCPDVVASVVRVDEQGKLRPVAGPSLASRYAAMMDGVAIGPRVGACGTAAWTGKTVVSSNIATDPNWEGIRHLALEQGLLACWSTPVIGKDGHILGTCAFYYRIPRQPDPFQRRLVDTCVHLCALAFERDLARQRIHQLAYHDQITGLPNRMQWMARAEQAVAAAAHANQPLAVFSVDLDRFKQVNDTYGQQAGDNLLRELGQRMLALLGPVDVVSRVSADEFVLLIIHCDGSRARVLAERLASAIGQPFHIGDTVLRPQASIGISLYPDNGRHADELLQRADLARLQGSKESSGQLRFYSESLDKAVLERRAMEMRLRQAFTERSLSVHYQPQIALDSGRLHGVEALARWQDPELGDISPTVFIPLAEETGLIGELGMYVLDQACRAMRLWQSQALEVDSVSINLSPSDFRDPALPHRVLACLARHGLHPCHLTVEITEALVLDRHPDTLRCLRTMSAAGIRLALDDFGTGYSGFSYLRELPVSEIKLDQSFITELATDPVSRALAQAVAHIGRTAGLSVIAEGVTNSHQAAMLQGLGFTAAQGFHYASAMSPDTLQQWVKQRPSVPV